MTKTFRIPMQADMKDEYFKYHGISYHLVGTIRYDIEDIKDYDNVAAQIRIFTDYEHVAQYVIIQPLCDEVAPHEFQTILDAVVQLYPKADCKVVYGFPRYH